MLDVITRRGDLELTLQIGAEILGSEDPRNRGDHPDQTILLNLGFKEAAKFIDIGISYQYIGNVEIEKSTCQ